MFVSNLLFDLLCCQNALIPVGIIIRGGDSCMVANRSGRLCFVSEPGSWLVTDIIIIIPDVIS